MKLVSSTNIMGSDKEFILKGRKFFYIMNSKGPKIDPWGTSCFNVAQSERITSSIRWFYFNFLFYICKVGPEPICT